MQITKIQSKQLPWIKLCQIIFPGSVVKSSSSEYVLFASVACLILFYVKTTGRPNSCVDFKNFCFANLETSGFLCMSWKTPFEY